MMTRILVLALTLASCAPSAHDVTGTTTAPATASDWRAVERELRAAGLALADAGVIEQPFWTRSARVYNTGEGDLQIYEFASSSDAETAMHQVDARGAAVGTSNISWMAPPHFYRRGSIIAIYLGTDAATLRRLQTVLGPQFAGQ